MESSKKMIMVIYRELRKTYGALAWIPLFAVTASIEGIFQDLMYKW